MERYSVMAVLLRLTPARLRQHGDRQTDTHTQKHTQYAGLPHMLHSYIRNTPTHKKRTRHNVTHTCTPTHTHTHTGTHTQDMHKDTDTHT